MDAIASHRVTFVYKGILYSYSKTNEHEDGKDDIKYDEIKYLVRKIKENIIEDSIDWMDVNDIDSNVYKTKKRLRSFIKRNNRYIMLRWLQIGCGSCFLHEPYGRHTEIGPPPSMDYDHDFPDLIKRAMFVYSIDCKIPYNINYLDDKNKCNLCQNYIINPYKVCHQHYFCYKCIKHWQEMINNP
eukprot:525444_1